MARFTLPRDLYHGKGAMEALKTFQGKKAIICVGGGSMKKFGFLDKAISYLQEAGMEVKLFEGIEPDPSVETVMKGAQAMLEFEPDWIIAMGGGSPIDAAKAMWIKYEYPDITFEEMCKVFGIPQLRHKAKFCAISSTSGTATEVTAFSIITDYSKGIKYPIADFEITPDVAIVDPELAETMPKKLVAHTGMDAMTHAIEAYVSTANCNYTDPLAIHAIEMIQKDLVASCNGDMAARDAMHDAQCLAGMAFSNALLGIVHSMAHKTGAAFSTGHIPHGCANAMYLPVPGVAMVAGHERYGGGITTPGGKPTMSVMCFGFDTFADASYACWDIHTRWAEKMDRRFGGAPNIRDFIVVPEGVFKSDEEIWEAMTGTIIEAGYEGRAGFQMDVATDTYHNKEDGQYYGLFNNQPKTKDQLYEFYLHIIKEFPFVILEDPFNEDDYDTTAALTKDSGIQIVGDDLFTTNLRRVAYGVTKGAANTVLLKVNQIGTISEALEMIQYAYKFGYAVMPSDSRGEGEAIADYAVGINAGSVRECGIGPRANRFMEIEAELGKTAKFLGARALKGNKNQQRADALERKE